MKHLLCKIHPDYQALRPPTSENPHCRCKLIYIQAKRERSDNPKHNRAARRERAGYPVKLPKHWGGTRNGFPPRKRQYKDLSLRDQIGTSISKKEIADLLVKAAALKGISPGTFRSLKVAASLRLKELEAA